MANILLIEPDYRSKFPPLGLMKLSTYHKSRKDQVCFIRGFDKEKRESLWDRIYISSLFTWDLPKTVKTIKYYRDSVNSPKDIIVGGPGVTLLPDYIKENTECTVIEGQIDKPNMMGRCKKVIAKLAPDYDILNEVDYEYYPKDAYFARITKGCIRNCKFCAVPVIEKEFGYFNDLKNQIKGIISNSGEKKNLVILDNNILAINNIEDIIQNIVDTGFERNAKYNNRKREVDFNQGLDARLISRNPKLASLLSKISLSPVRLALDFVGMEKSYIRAIRFLHDKGFREFLTYILYNFKDSPEDFYKRIWLNLHLNKDLDIKITGFPMRYTPINQVNRGFVSKNWKWRYLRGIRCVQNATRGLIGTNPSFVLRAFGSNYEEFIEILSMPDRYIMFRKAYENNGALDWKRAFRRLSLNDKNEFLDFLGRLNGDRNKSKTITRFPKYRNLIEHYYPNGESPPRNPREEIFVQ